MVLEPAYVDLYFDLLLARRARAAAPSPEIGARFGALIESTLDEIVWNRQEGPEFDESVARAARLLREGLAGMRYRLTDASVFLLANSHIDVGYRWRTAESVRKCARTFSTALRMMEEYPGYVFFQSQPQLYQYVKDRYPALYGQIRRRVAEGRWEADGAMWVEPDCNLPSGESLVRQVLRGKRFFRQEFGVDSRVCWLQWQDCLLRVTPVQFPGCYPQAN